MPLIVLLWLWLTPSVWTESVPFYHEPSVITFKPPHSLRPYSYFGFSTAYDPYSKSLIISAPRENNIGAVYQCDIKSQSCFELRNNIKRYKPTRYNVDYWFGATVKTGSTFIMACAPKFIMPYNKGANIGINMGQCYTRRKHKKKFTSRISIEYQNMLHTERDMETLGWALDIGPGNAIIVGGPGMFRKTGVAGIVPANSKSEHMSLALINEIHSTRDRGPSYNFGYNVAVGYFIEEGELSYAVSSTYGNYGTGQVYFYTYNGSEFMAPIELEEEEDVGLVGSMFGAVLCAANLHEGRSGNATDLLVGAPTYAPGTATYNVGAVYVYTYNKGDSPKYKRKIMGRQDGSQFGSSIIILGDLNGDGADEVAIGAPFEDEGRGAVYVYCGSSLASNDAPPDVTWRQRLQPEGHHSFGLALAAVRDYDNNGCNELAISAPFDDRVILYRCVPVVIVTKLSAHFPSFENRANFNKTDFEFKVCIDVKYLPPKPKKIKAYLSTDVEIRHPDAVLINPNKDFRIFNFQKSLRYDQSQYCQNVFLRLPRDGDYNMAINYEISTTLLDNPDNLNRFDGTRPVLSDLSVHTYTGAVWASMCPRGGNETNNLYFTVSSSMRNTSIPFTIGSSDRGNLSIIVVNTASELAHSPYLHVVMSPVLVYQLPTDCYKLEEVSSAWKCSPIKALKPEQRWIDIAVDLKDLTNKHQSITFDVILFDGCGADNVTQVHTHVVPLKSSIELIHIKGITNIGETVNMTDNDLLYSGKELEHVYRIVNNGPTNFVELISVVTLHKQGYIKLAAVPVSYFVEASEKVGQIEKTCERIKETELELTVQCRIHSLSKQATVKVVAFMEIAAGSAGGQYRCNLRASKACALRDRQHDQGVQAFHCTALITKQAVLTTVQRQVARVDLRLQVIGGSLGLGLLLILVLLLNRFDCLRRKKKEDLEIVKKHVEKRKSMASGQFCNTHM